MIVALRDYWRRLPEALRWGLGVYAPLRLVYWVWGGVLLTLLPLPALAPIYQPPVPDPGGVAGWLLSPWNRWDVLWYLRIAVQGYGFADGRTAFGPLFPALIALAGKLLGGQYLVAAFLISDACCVATLALLFALAKREGYAAPRALGALLLYPFAFFLFLPYTESLLLMLVLVTFWAMGERRWIVAGVACSLAVLTKFLAIVLVAPMSWELWEQRQEGWLKRAGWLALPVAVAGSWMIMRSMLAGNANVLDFSSKYGWLTPFLSQEYTAAWGDTERLSWPGEALWLAVSAPFRLWPHPYTITAVIDLLVILLVAYLTWQVFRLPRRSYALYTTIVFFMPLVLVVRDVPLQDAPRRWMMAFPLFLAASQYVPPRLERPLIYTALASQVLLTGLWVKWIVVG
jgi:hypothetical protein